MCVQPMGDARRQRELLERRHHGWEEHYLHYKELKRMIKQLEEGGGEDAAAEVELLSKCDHPNVLPLLGYCLQPPSPCLVFPLMSGGTLEDRILLTEPGKGRLRALGHATPMVTVSDPRQATARRTIEFICPRGMWCTAGFVVGARRHMVS